MNRRRICVVTSSRSDYGLLYWLMKEIEGDAALRLQIIATGMHLSPKHGMTSRIIEKDGFKIDKKIPMLLPSDNEPAIIRSIGKGLVSFPEALLDLKPDLLVFLGDRYELLAPAIAAFILKIPVAHLHGGETSQGAIDESVRHCLTKIASIHFPATEEYRRRIIQMGENPNLVFNFGAPGLDNIYKHRLLKKEELEDRLEFVLSGRVAIVTYHPVTLEHRTAEVPITNILKAIKSAGLRAIFTAANADTYGSIINRKIKSFCKGYPDDYQFSENLGQIPYLSCLKNLDLMIGNSSSGLVEAPSFKLPVVNIGDRQRGRIKAENVIDVGYSVKEIRAAIGKACSSEFKKMIRNMKNPYDKYGDGKVSYRIKETLKKISLSESLLKKKFNDIQFKRWL